MGNPNAIAGGAGGLAGTLVIAIAGWFGADLDPVVAGIIATICASIVLFIGRNGFDGVKQIVMHGNKPAPPPPPAVPPPVPKPTSLKKKGL